MVWLEDSYLICIFNYLDTMTLKKLLRKHGKELLFYRQVLKSRIKKCIGVSYTYLEPIEQINDTLENKNLKLLYLLQNSDFFNLLLCLKNLFMGVNSTEYRIIDDLFYEFHLFKMVNPYFNSLHVDNREPFALLDIEDLNISLTNKNDNKNNSKKELIAPVAKSYKYIIDFISDYTFLPQDNLDNFKIILDKVIPHYKAILDKGFILAGGCPSALLFNFFCKEEDIFYKDVDFFYVENLFSRKVRDVLIDLHNFFLTKNLNFICIRQGTMRDYWTKEKIIYKLATETDTDIKNNLYYRISGTNYDFVLLSDEEYSNFGFPKEKDSFVFDEIDVEDIIDDIKEQAIVYLQFISIKFNKCPETLDKAVGILLNNFDISVCQSAVYKQNNNNYKTVLTTSFWYSIFKEELYYNHSESWPGANGIKISRLQKYTDKWGKPCILSKFHGEMKYLQFNVNACKFYDDLVESLKNIKIKKNEENSKSQQ